MMEDIVLITEVRASTEQEDLLEDRLLMEVNLCMEQEDKPHTEEEVLLPTMLERLLWHLLQATTHKET